MTGSGDAPLHDNYGRQACGAVQREAELPTTAWGRAMAHSSRLGLTDARSIKDIRVAVFARAGFTPMTFLKEPFVEDVRPGDGHDVIVFGAQALRRVHAPGAFPVAPDSRTPETQH